jgi:alpha-methylacyl-CoA racemase
MKYLHFHLIFNLLLLFINIITIICCCFFQVQCIEPKFYLEFLKGMGLENAKGLPHQHDRESWPWMEARFSSIFLTKTRDEWSEIFSGTDACCWPVLTASEAAVHPHNVARGSFAPSPGREGEYEPVSKP